MMNLDNDLLMNCLVSNNVNLKNNNAENNIETSNINEFKDMLNSLSIEKVSSKLSQNHNLTASQNIINAEKSDVSNDISQMKAEDVLILDVEEDTEFSNRISSLVKLLDNENVTIEDIISIINESDSIDELEDAMSKLLSELTTPIMPINNISIEEDNSISQDMGFELNQIDSIQNSTALEYLGDSLDLNIEDNNDIDKIINHLENSNEALEDKDITDILSKLKRLCDKEDLNNELKSELSDNKKKEVMLSLDNFNINIAHNKAINLNGIESVDEIQTVASKIFEKISTAIQEKLSGVNLDEQTIEIRLKLYPKNLGELTINIVDNDGKLNIKIFSENSSIKEFISSSMNELIDSLNNKKLAIDDIEVLSFGDTGASFGSDNDNSSNNPNSSSHKLTKFSNFIDNDNSDEILNNFESSESNSRNLYVNI